MGAGEGGKLYLIKLIKMIFNTDSHFPASDLAMSFLANYNAYYVWCADR